MLELRLLQTPEPLRHLDYTHPFAHRPLVEFLMTVPADVLCRPGEPRRLMRRALADLWPPKLRKRRSKAAFTVPWIEALRPLARDLMSGKELQLVERGFLDRTSVLSRLAAPIRRAYLQRGPIAADHSAGVMATPSRADAAAQSSAAQICVRGAFKGLASCRPASGFTKAIFPPRLLHLRCPKGGSL